MRCAGDAINGSALLPVLALPQLQHTALPLQLLHTQSLRSAAVSPEVDRRATA